MTCPNDYEMNAVHFCATRTETLRGDQFGNIKCHRVFTVRNRGQGNRGTGVGQEDMEQGTQDRRHDPLQYKQDNKYNILSYHSPAVARGDMGWGRV